MRTILCQLAIVMFIASTSAFAQSDRHSGEFMVGYQFNRVEQVNFPAGFMFSGTSNFSDFAGVKVEGSFTSRSGLSAGTTMGGIQIKDNKKEGSAVRPFVHVLGGWVRYTGFGVSNNFGMAFGGGVDIKVSDRISIRAGQVDYRRSFGSVPLDSFRFGGGLVIHLGK